MSDLEAFKLYMAVRVAFLHNIPDIITSGHIPKNWNKLIERPDHKLIRHLLNLSGDSKKTLLRLCVGNFLYGNPDFLYKEEHTRRLMHRHIEYWKHIDKYLQDDLDIIQLRLYNFSNIKEYLDSKNFLDDVLSCRIRMETFCLIYATNNEFLPKEGYLFGDIAQRIRIGSAFLELTEDRKKLILKYLCE